MKYTVTCFNGGPVFGFQIPFVRLEEARVDVESNTESDAISLARSKVSRDFYEMVGVRE